MIPSDLGDFSSGFSSSAQNAEQSLNFDTLSSANKGLSRPRFVKVRRQSNAHDLKPAEESSAGPGFNPFRSGAGQAAPGVHSAKWDLDHGMRNLKIGTGSDFRDITSNAVDKGGFVFGADQSKSSSFSSNIHENMKKLNINDSEKVVDRESDPSYDVKAKVGFANVGVTSVGKSSVESALPDELKKKLNVKETGGSYGGGGTFSAGNVKKNGVKHSEKNTDVVDEILEGAIRNRVKNLKINDYVNTGHVVDNTKLKDRFAFGSNKSTRGSAAEDRVNILSSEIGRKLNIRSAMREPYGETGMPFSSSAKSYKDVQSGNRGDTKSHGYDTVLKGYNFNRGIHSKDDNGSQVPNDQPRDVTQTNTVPGQSFVFSSGGLAGRKAFGVPPSGGPKVDEISFMNMKDGLGSPFVEFKTPNCKDDLLSSPSKKVEFSAKFKDFKGENKRGKMKQPTEVHLWPGQDFVSGGTDSQDIPEASESYSPMDVSPYQETLSDPQISRENSVASEEIFSYENHRASTDSQTAIMDDAVDEDLIAATQRMDINEEEPKCQEVPEEGSEHCFDDNIGAENSVDDCISGDETESFKSANEEMDSFNDITVTSRDSEASSSSRIERQDSDTSTQFFSAASSDDIGGSGFNFSVSSAAKSSGDRDRKKKNWSKVGHDSFCFSPNEKDNIEVLRAQEIKQVSGFITAASIAAQEACEKWRLRGNQAYSGGDLFKAEDCYTKGVNCVSKSETSQSCLRALMLCYSNRAATLMSLGRMRDALGDCKMAAAIDPNFLRVQVRAANCYLALGEIEDALQHFKKCLQLATDARADQKIAIEASEGLQRAQKVHECMQHSSELLQKKTSNGTELALELIAEALLISSYSEKLLEMKAESLFMLRKYEAAIQLCEQTLDSAKRNSFPLNADYHLENLDGQKLGKDSSFILWRSCLIFRSYFYLGKLEAAIGSLEKLEELDSVTKSFHVSSEAMESLIPLAATARELLLRKTAGNEAFQAGKHSDAIEHYTAAVSCSIESRPFAAICFCNRAAAYKALGQIVDAIADCNLAIALDGNYTKAISRRSTLYEMIRDYGQASNDLERLVSILMRQMEENQFPPPNGSTNLTNDLREAHRRVSMIEEESRKEIPLDMYLILGVESSASVSEIKKAYRRAALRHHPDKVGQSLARSDNGDDVLWKEIGEAVHTDADRLFKMIGEAYAVLSDPTTRSQYDLEEEARNAPKKQNGNGTYKSYTYTRNHPFESSSRRRWRDVRRSHGR